MAWNIFRIVAVVVLLAAAAVLLTDRSRLPLALRGLAKTLGARSGRPEGVSNVRRTLAFALIILAFLLCIA